MGNPKDTVERGGNLIPFKKGDSGPSGNRGRGRPTKLNDPDYIEQFAHAIAEGLTNAELAETFSIGDRTVRDHKKDPRVKAAALKYVEDRILRITRKTDSKLDALVDSEDFKQLPIDDRIALLLKIRKEFLGGVIRLQAESGRATAETINDTLEELESNPELAREFAEMAARLDTSKE